VRAEPVRVCDPTPEFIVLSLEPHQRGEVRQLDVRRDVSAGQDDKALEILFAPRPGKGGVGEDSRSEKIFLDRTGEQRRPQSRAGRAQVHALPGSVLQGDDRELEHVGADGKREVLCQPEGAGVVVGAAHVVDAADHRPAEQRRARPVSHCPVVRVLAGGLACGQQKKRGCDRKAPRFEPAFTRIQVHLASLS
jgi:hypothetical protein